MCSDGDYDAYDGLASRTPAWHVYSADRVTEEVLLRSDPMKRHKAPLSRRKRLYRRLGQMFLRWAETDGGKW